MKERRQNDREIRVEDDNIRENTTARSPLPYRNILYVLAYIQSQKTRRKLERHFVSTKI